MSRPQYYFLSLLLLLLACTSGEKAIIPSAALDETGELLVSDSDKAAIRKRGPEEFKKLKQIKDSSPSFPNVQYTKIIAYELDGRVAQTGAAAVFHQRTGRARVLKTEESAPFLQLINDKASYGVAYAGCHDPKLGLVFYQKETPVAYLSLCLACNNLYTQPRLSLGFNGAGDGGFTKEARKIIRMITEDWGFLEESISIFDHEDSIRAILQRKGFSKEEIDQEIFDISH